MDSILQYTPRSSSSLEFPLAEIAVFGEYATAEGPYLEDYYLVVVSKDGSWCEIPFSAAGVATTIHRLSDIWGCELRLTLQLSTAYCSNILWPNQLSGLPLFEFTFGSWVWRKFTGGLPESRQLSSHVCNFLSEASE